MAACGDPLADGDYLGTPLAEVRGRAVSGGGDVPQPARPHVGLVWPRLTAFPGYGVGCDPPVDGGDASGGPSFYAAAARIEAAFPSDFRILLYDPPPQDAIGAYRDCQGNLEGRMAIAFVMAFDDLDRDGTFSEASTESGADRPIGFAEGHMLIYVDVPPRPGSFAYENVFANPEAATRGYHVVEGICGEGEDGTDRIRILEPFEPLEVLVAPVDPDAEIELHCFSFLWPGGR